MSIEEIEYWADKMLNGAYGPVIPPDHLASSDILKAMRGKKVKDNFLNSMCALLAKEFRRDLLSELELCHRYTII